MDVNLTNLVITPSLVNLTTHNNMTNYNICLHEVNYFQNQNFFRFVVNGVLLNIVGVFGIMGNLISMIILSRPQMRSSINYLLIGLARVDTVLIVTSILLFGLPGIYPYSRRMLLYFFKVYPNIVPFIFPLATVMQTASVYLTMTVSLERYVAVCHPLRARSLCTYGRARVYVIVIFMFSIVYNLPRLWESRIESQWSEEHNMTIYCPVPSDFRDDNVYQTVYIHWMYLIVMYLIPFLSLAVLNGSIYIQVLKANRERQRLSRLQQREIGLATMLMCVVVVFFVCNILPMIINIIETFKIHTEKVFDVAMMINLSNFLVTINSSVNFIIYVIFGEKFQRLFLMLFCHNALFFPGRDSPDGTHEDSFVSNGDRSFRLHRQGTSISRNGGSRYSNRMNGSTKSNCTNKSNKTPSPGPCVYYPISRANKELSTFTTHTLLPE